MRQGNNFMTINVVCLHGFGQNAEKLRGKCVNLFRGCKRCLVGSEFHDVVYHFLDGPVTLPGDGPRAWWVKNPDNPTDITWDDVGTNACHGLEESVTKVTEFCLSIKGGVVGRSL